MPLTLVSLASAVALTYTLSKMLGYTFNIVVVVRDAVKISTSLLQKFEKLEARVAHVEGSLGIVPAQVAS